VRLVNFQKVRLEKDSKAYLYDQVDVYDILNDDDFKMKKEIEPSWSNLANCINYLPKVKLLSCLHVLCESQLYAETSFYE